jgi:hypothetical protein
MPAVGQEERAKSYGRRRAGAVWLAAALLGAAMAPGAAEAKGLRLVDEKRPS